MGRAVANLGHREVANLGPTLHEEGGQYTVNEHGQRLVLGVPVPGGLARLHTVHVYVYVMVTVRHRVQGDGQVGRDLHAYVNVGLEGHDAYAGHSRRAVVARVGLERLGDGYLPVVVATVEAMYQQGLTMNDELTSRVGDVLGARAIVMARRDGVAQVHEGLGNHATAGDVRLYLDALDVAGTLDDQRATVDVQATTAQHVARAGLGEVPANQRVGDAREDAVPGPVVGSHHAIGLRRHLVVSALTGAVYQTVGMGLAPVGVRHVREPTPGLHFVSDGQVVHRHEGHHHVGQQDAGQSPLRAQLPHDGYHDHHAGYNAGRRAGLLCYDRGVAPCSLAASFASCASY